MRRILVFFAAALLLSGCGSEAVFETVADEWAAPVMAKPREISVRLPDHVVAPVLESENGQIYLCEDYEILIEQKEAGDVAGTIQSLCGYTMSELTVLQRKEEFGSRYEFVWACAGEAGERLGRAVILDDGNYHYCMSVLRPAGEEKTSQIVWSDVFSSFSLV